MLSYESLDWGIPGAHVAVYGYSSVFILRLEYTSLSCVPLERKDLKCIAPLKHDGY